MKNITIRVDKKLHEKLKIKLIQQGTDMSKLLREFIKSYVKDPEETGEDGEKSELRWDQ